MGDKNNEEKKKKNPPPAAKSAKRRKKKGPAAAVKIPQGESLTIIPCTAVYNLFNSDFLYIVASISYLKMQAASFET